MADPFLHGLVPLLQAKSEFQQFSADLRRGPLAPGEEPLALHLIGAARPYVTAVLAAELDSP
ncbi:MAG: hypothetical protein ACRDIB_18715, partial [Ardenticatenaceae bacterium]